MRNFFSDKAGASFYVQAPNYTSVIRKYYIELIFKIQKGHYGIVNMSAAGNGKAILSVCWNEYFKRLQNPAVQMPKIRKCCPTLYNILVGEGTIYDGRINDPTDDKDYDCICMEVDVPKDTALIHCLNRDIRDKANMLLNTCIDCYNELVKNPPFPAWKDGLDELWS
jgi:hypothetical protein